MTLQDLEIARKQFGQNKGKFEGSATFDNELGSVTLHLTPEHIEKILLVCADSIVSVASQAAKEMTCHVIEHVKQFEKVEK